MAKKQRKDMKFFVISLIMKHLLFTFAIIAMITASSCNEGRQADTTPGAAVIENIMTRTSIRAYTSEPVPRELIETIVKAGMAAPSAMNRQPWHIIVLDNRDTLDAFAASLRHARMLEQAPVALVVCAQTHISLNDGTAVENRFWQHDASAVAQNILLAAHALGLGAVWTAASDPERAAIVREALGVPEGIMPLCVIPVGWPAENPAPKDKWKPEKVHYNRW